MCFGTGLIEEASLPITTEMPIVRPRQKQRQKAPSKQRALRPEDGRLETALTTISGIAGAKDARTIISALRLLKTWAEREKITDVHHQEIRHFLARAVMAERKYSSLFITTLAAEMRKRGATLRTSLVDLQYFLKDGGVSVKVTEPLVRTLVKAYNTQNALRIQDEYTAHEYRSGPPPTNNVHLPTGAKVLQSPPKQKAEKPRAKPIAHVLVTADGPLDDQKLQDCARFIDRHKMPLIYIAGSKRGIRELKTAFSGVQTMPVTNPANLEMIKRMDNIAILSADKPFQDV